MQSTRFGVGSIETRCWRARGGALWALTMVPWAGRSRSLQRHHTAHPITGCMSIASSDAIRPGRLGGFPPARQDLHAGSSVVGGPWQANILAPSLFAAYSMLRVLTGLPWRRRFWELAGPHSQSVCMQAFFGQNGSGLDLGSHEAKEPSRPGHKC